MAGSHQLILSGYILRPLSIPDHKGERHGREPPVDLEWVHPQTLVHTRGVGQEGCQGSFKAKTKVHEMILHALLEDRVLPGLANDEISPLDNHNRYKESCMTGVLQYFPISIGPLLTIRVLQVIDGLGVPGSTEAKESRWPEPVLTQNNEVDKEASRSLDHTNLTISH